MRIRGTLVSAVAVALAVTGWNGTAEAQKAAEKDELTKVTFKVEGMTCGGCEAAVKMAAKNVEGVKDAKASHEKGTAEITYDPAKTTPEAIAKAITENSGFKAHVPKADNK